MFLKRLDLLSPKITLYVDRKLRHSSLFSGIFTISIYTILIAFGFYFAQDLIQRKNPSAFYFNRYVEDAGSFPLNSSSMFTFLQTLTLDTNLPDPVDFDSLRIYGIQEFIQTYSVSGRDISKYEHWMYGKCNNDSDTKGIGYLITMEYFTESACIRKYYNNKEKKYYNTNEKGFVWPSLDKGRSNPTATYYGIIIEQCRNDSFKNDCKSIEEIEKYASKHSIQFNMIDHYTDVYDYEKPLSKYFYKIQNGLYDNSYTTNHLNFNPAIVKTHNGYVFDNQIKELSYFFVQNEIIDTHWEGANKGIYVAYYFWMQNRMQYYERTYKRIQDILADIDGTSNCILLISVIINRLVSKYITILDTEKILIEVDRKTANNIYNTEKIFPENFNKPHVHFEKKGDDEEKNSIKNTANTEKNNATKSDGYNQSIGTKNVMSNNYFMSSNVNNNYVKVLNKEKEVSKQVLKPDKKVKEYQTIQKISFNFFNYLLFIFFNKRNNILVYKEFRRKVLSEEHLIQNYFDVYELLRISKSRGDASKVKGNYRLSKILSSVDNKFKINE